MNKSALTINRVNLKSIKMPYVVTGAVFVVMIVQDLIKLIISGSSGSLAGQSVVSAGNMLWLLIPLAAIYIPLKNYRRIINLGGKRINFFFGSLATYIVLAGIVSLASTLIYYTYDRFVNGTGYFDSIMNLLEIFGWSANGPIIAFFQQFAFLLLAAMFIHTLTAMQDMWYGWVTDLAIGAIISVFVPIAPLRAALLWFFDLIIFHSNAALQIISCIVLAALIYAVSLPVLSRKRI